MTAMAGVGSWWDLAACGQADPEVFFPVSADAAAADLARAKAICAPCVIRNRCLDFALQSGEAHGVWGGLSEDERRQLSGRRRRLARSNREMTRAG